MNILQWISLELIMQPATRGCHLHLQSIQLKLVFEVTSI